LRLLKCAEGESDLSTILFLMQPVADKLSG